jgi:hypothetical protein
MPDVDDTVLTVGMTTFHGTGREDTSCILEPGDHPAVKQKSYIRYDKACAINYRGLLEERFRGLITMNDDLKKEVILRIQEGARKSPALPRKFVKFFASF